MLAFVKSCLKTTGAYFVKPIIQEQLCLTRELQVYRSFVIHCDAGTKPCSLKCLYNPWAKWGAGCIYFIISEVRTLLQIIKMVRNEISVM